MSIREIQDFIHQNSQITFIDGRKDEGMIVARYNIPAAKLEYYFIPESNIKAFQASNKHIAPNPFYSFGQPVEISDILDARRIN